ncbi:OmpA family protein [bacterium]|nr:OmpA family protein [bacterium]
MERIARSLQVLLILVLATGMMTTTGCKWFGKKKVQAAPTAEVTPTQPQNQPAYGQRGQLVPLPEMKVIYFGYDKFNIRPDQLDAMEANVKYLKENSDIKLYITGHCDERGSIEYNFNLGMKRASAVRDYLVSKGIPAAQIEIGSKGKEQPADLGKTEKAYAKNRRAEFQRML